ncbi:MAG: hypothetical protein ACTHMG_13620 [Sphingomonas sp.]
MRPHADDMAPPDWRRLAVTAEQAWLAPLVIGVAWWNAALDAWLELGFNGRADRIAADDHGVAHH